ncbi:MAG: GDP-mannose 4,6-dehydratase [Gemmatimonadota bacterium]|nr:GDP-mannose 4,6-dehydratase [Gemmatimonadota bacterium]
MKRILVTGAAGFIGSHLVERLLDRGLEVVGLDNFDDFYDPTVKRSNLEAALDHAAFELVEGDIRDAEALDALPDGWTSIVHLAARAGVRPSIEQPILYQDVNVTGTQQLLEVARRRGVDEFVFGSSSSVYGNNRKIPFSESDPVDHPISPYAATKRAGELLCHTYSHLFGLGCLCLRFFTVYGPRQRPDLAIHKFTRLLSAGETIQQFGDGTTKRDYTHIEDILQGVEAAIEYTAGHPGAFDIVNLGESQTVELSRLIGLISSALGVEPRIEVLPPQPGDVEQTYADISHARRLLGYAPETPIDVGIPGFVDWYRRANARD